VIVSDSLWHPLWDPSQIDSSALGLAKFIGERYKISYGSDASASASASAVATAVATIPLTIDGPAAINQTNKAVSASETDGRREIAGHGASAGSRVKQSASAENPNASKAIGQKRNGQRVGTGGGGGGGGGGNRKGNKVEPTMAQSGSFDASTSVIPTVNPNSVTPTTTISSLDEFAPTLPPGYTVVPSRQLQLSELWEILTKPRNQIEPGKVYETFDELGIDNAASLEQCTAEDLQELAGYLRKIPRALFLARSMEL
jgi:hypothetical protein